MKKAISILLLLIYVNVAFGIGIDCHYCDGKLLDVKLHGFGIAECKCPPGQMSMGCCKNETHVCKTDNHQAQIGSPTIVYPSTEAPIVLTDDSSINIPETPFIAIFDYHHFFRELSSRQILALIHTLRI